MIGDLKEETMEEAIEAVTIGDLAHLEGEIEAEPAILQEEMIVEEEVDSVGEVIAIVAVIVAEIVAVIVVEIAIVESMIGDLLPVLCLQQETIEEMIAGMIVVLEMIVVPEMILLHRLPNVNRVGRKLMVATVGLQFLNVKNYDYFLSKKRCSLFFMNKYDV